MSDPLVSFLLLTFNRRALLARALRSVTWQTYGNMEILVFDDASTDDTERFMASKSDPRIRYFRSADNRGECVTRNLAVAEATGKYLCWLDDDDLSNIYRVEFQVLTMERFHPSFLWTGAEKLNKSNQRAWRRPPIVVDRILHNCTSTMVETEKARSVPYATDVLCGCDILWELEMTKKFGTALALPFALYYRDLKQPDRLSKVHRARPDFDVLMEHQITEKLRLLNELKVLGIVRWPRRVSAEFEQELLERLV